MSLANLALRKVHVLHDGILSRALNTNLMKTIVIGTLGNSAADVVSHGDHSLTYITIVIQRPLCVQQNKYSSWIRILPNLLVCRFGFDSTDENAKT